MTPITAEQVQTLQDLRPSLRIVTPSSSDYDEAISRPWPPDKRHAGAVAFPTSTDDVVALIRFCSSKNINIAVKSGGHGHYGSSIAHGLCIDLSSMGQVSVDTGRRVVVVQGGATWNHVYAAAAREGLAVVGGETSNVGVGGLVLHGGYGWLTGANGLAVDNVLEMEVVLASGMVVPASERENADIFWALKGAGGSFGIVTKFILKAFEQRNVLWFGYMKLGSMSDEKLAAIVEVSNKILSDDNRSGIAALNWALQPDVSVMEGRQSDAPKEPAELVVAPFYNGPEKDAVVFFKPLLTLHPRLNTCKMVSFVDTHSHFRGLSPDARISGNGSAVIYPFRLDLIKTMLQDFNNFLIHVPDTQSFGSFIGFEVHNAHAIMEFGPSRTAYPARGNHANIRVVLAWKKEESDQACQQWLNKHTAGWVQEFRRRQQDDYGLDPVTKTSTGLYPNYDGSRLNANEMFGHNYRRLLELKRKYDGRNMFVGPGKFDDFL